MVQDFNNINFSINGMQSFFKEQGVEINSSDSKKLESIFNECDTTNEKGEKKPDGVLTGNERTSFMDKVKSACPNIYQKVVDFFTVIDVKEDLEAARKETIESLKDQNTKEQDKKNDPDFMD